MTEKGTIQIDNQAIQVSFRLPSGRFQVLDKVSGVCWSMFPGAECGTIQVEENSELQEYKLGVKGKKGVLLTSNYYITRNTEIDDFYEVHLSGTLGDNPDTTITLRYLLSKTFPVLNCFCFIEGKRFDYIKRISFPRGFHIPHQENSHILIPRDIKHLTEEHLSAEQHLWEPSPLQSHRVAGTPFFIILRQKENNQASTCIGYTQHPRVFIDIAKEPKGWFITPSSNQLEETGKSEKKPYHIRYQFAPTSDKQAIEWLYQEQLLAEDYSFVF